MPIRLCFFGYDGTSPTHPLAASAGIGQEHQVVGVDSQRYTRLKEEASQHWIACAEEDDPDLFVYAHEYTPSSPTHAEADLASRLGKPCLFFHRSDDTTPNPPAYGTLYRDSILASEASSSERCMPAFADDLLRETGGLQILEKPEKPSVGFCGFVGSQWKRILFQLQGRSAKVLGLRLRTQSLNTLERSPLVGTDFVRRTAFWGGAISRIKGADKDKKQQVRQEYLDNIASNGYTLCLRGAGNFSYRLYETLAMGRIPLFINTDSQLPFDHRIDWKRHCVWVEQEEIPRIGEILHAFHSQFDNDQFEQLQQDNRRLWEDYLRPTEAYQQVLEALLVEG